MSEKIPIRKSMLPNGPWTDEPDELCWVHRNLPCVIVRAPFWSLNGYVGIDIDHPLYGLRYDEESPKLTEAFEKLRALPMDSLKMGMGQMLCALSGGMDGLTPGVALQVHGGVTYAADKCPDDPLNRRGLWWFGFDTGHYMDYSPGLYYNSPNADYFRDNNTYRDLAYVKKETEELAEQLAYIGQKIN